jgi:hypothetical protein
MPECQTMAGGYLSMSATALAGHNGVWFASWTKYAPNLLTTETHGVLCAAGTCTPDKSTPCTATDSDNFQRDVATESVHLAGDPAEQSYAVVVSPGLSSDTDAGTTSASIVAAVAQLTSPLEKTSTTTAIGAPLTLSSQTTGADLRGPDFPAVAVLPGSQVKVAISWIEPSASGESSDVLRLQRYRMCLPKP